MASAGLEVKETGRALRFQTESPHLVSMGSGRLSTAVTLHPLPEGRVILGSDRNADIPVSGTGVEAVHCAIENNNGVVILHPINGNTTIDGSVTNSSVRLAQGCMISIGRSNYMRFNHPAEAKHLKAVLPNSRISMAPISFSLLPENTDLERKPPVVPRKSPRNSCSDEEVGFLGKLTKFEMLARQSRNCVSPKVFPAGSLTTNVPADQILGHSRSSSLISLSKSHNSPLQNLTNFDRSRSNTPNHIGSPGGHLGPGDKPKNRIESRTPSRSNTPNNSYHTSTPNHNQIQVYSSTEAYLKTSTPNYIENDENYESLAKFHGNSVDLMSRSLTCPRSSDYDKFGREFDMSQSLIVAKTTTTEYLQVEQYGSNPNLCRPSVHCTNGSFNSPHGCGPNFPTNFNAKRIQPPSPAFNRNPRYCDQKRLHGRVKSPTPSVGSGCSLEELRERQIDAENKRKEAECRRKLAQEERVKEQEIEKQEKMRLEEILAMCAEYERQSAGEKPRQPNRIKTNGSLPRDKRPGYNSPYSPKSPSSHQPQFSFESPKHSPPNRLFHQNGSIPNNIRALPDPPSSPNNNRWSISPTNSHHGFSTSISQARGLNHENVKMQNGETDKQTELPNQSTFSTIQLNGTRIASNSVPNYENISVNGSNSIYENVVSPQNNNHNNTLKRNGHLTSSCEVIENKLAISNDDLLEAIEQLSILSKSKDNCVTPKKNNTERDNAKSNEAKADKERRELEEEDKKKYIEFLQNEKVHILGNMEMLKRSIADIEIQEEEISRELELEKALLSAEYESESLKLTTDEAEKISLQMRINDLEREMADDTASQANLQAEAKRRVDRSQELCDRLEEDLKYCEDDSKQHEIAEKLNAQQEILETERKTFEDLEFHHLEEEASKLATREELQRYLSELSNKIEARRSQLNHLESQRSVAKATATKESRTLERQKLGHMRRLEEGRNRIRAIDDELEKLTRNTADNPEDKRSPSREDFDRISRVTTDSPIVNNQGSLGRKTIESLKEIERNRQLHLAKQGSQVISEERRRVEELKRRVQDEVRSQWEERKLNCASFNSVESGEESSSYSTGPTESGSGSSDGADTAASEKMSPSKLSEFTSPSPGPSTNSYSLLQSENMRDDRRSSMEGERLSGTSVGLADGSGSRPLSQTSSEMDSVRSLQTVKHRDKPKLQRPLTRYLPIKSESLDLRHHIETAGHQLPLIHDVTVDTTTCAGYLSKMSKKFHHWNKRWFVFDRKRKTLSYFSDSHSKKARGLIYFQSIEEVYVDHMNTVRSPQPSLTFIIKTSTRLYHLMAPSPEAMRVWVDVVFTGAEGYHEFDHGV
ncbi:pleckstrin homology-like domain family B member 1 isoform X2 [Fopius arisanus]|uniref:Phldb1_0 protein n=1 Tax=Fopius arisanus TaxID=64838 RepID=A0A0C9RU79_9HYME|nr:PREDICTED: pleckstrin homology-like domain family B member 1 isoform X2 [Fopius arisanus]